MRDDRHLVEVWLSNAEKKDTSLRDGLKRLYAEYKKKKYLVAVFESGEGDLYQSTLELLSYNKKRCAEIEVNREKQRITAAGWSVFPSFLLHLLSYAT